MKADVVIVHYNNPLALIRTCLAIKERRNPNVRFLLIDNNSTRFRRKLASFILRTLTVHSKIIVRPNLNREAGGYWHYIKELYKDADLVVFTQDELHQTGMRPKGVPNEYDTRAYPYYTERYGVGGLSLQDCFEWLTKNPFDCIGFGGRRCRASTDFDPRFTTPYWRARWSNLHLQYFDFFSGACFAVSSRMIKKYIDLADPTQDDLDNGRFAWMWERMWGTLPSYAGGKLVHYLTKETARIDAIAQDAQSSADEFNYTKPRQIEGDLSVSRMA